ncbi:hypothetical protein EYV94_11485 [Puteibacter caeruleilacunae]|nr:hypothetical protein EYV94_11485 [Puteibacter caeruleilacunae]
MKRFSILYILTFKWISLVVVSTIINSCGQSEKCSSELICSQLDSIEAVMFKTPNLIDSLLQQLDTTDITSHERARIQMCKGYYLSRNGEFDESIKILIEAEDYFIKGNDEYHIQINRMIRALVFEQLWLFYDAAKLLTQCDIYFTQHNHKALRFYSSLGLLRLHKQLGLQKEEQELKLKKLALELDDEYYNAVLFTSISYISDNDSLKLVNYAYARKIYKKLRRWPAVYAMDYNLLNTKFRMNDWLEIAGCDTKLSPKDYVYTPTPHQQLRNMYLKALVLERSRRNEEALQAAHKALNFALKIKAVEEEKQSLKMLAILYNRIGEYGQAYEMEQKYVDAKDRQKRVINKSQLIVLGANYYSSELEREALVLRLKKKNFQLLLLGFFVLLCVMSVGIWYVVRRKENKRKQLVQTNVKINENIKKKKRVLKEEEIEKNNLASKLKAQRLKSTSSKELKILLNHIDNNRITSWSEYETCFHKMKPGWVDKLKKKYPDLTVTEIKYCMCIYFKLYNYEISRFTGDSFEFVKIQKETIREKTKVASITSLYWELRDID